MTDDMKIGKVVFGSSDSDTNTTAHSRSAAIVTFDSQQKEIDRLNKELARLNAMPLGTLLFKGDGGWLNVTDVYAAQTLEAQEAKAERDAFLLALGKIQETYTAAPDKLASVVNMILGNINWIPERRAMKFYISMVTGAKNLEADAHAALQLLTEARKLLREGLVDMAPLRRGAWNKKARGFLDGTEVE